ncbi:MAG: hypothetical protein CHACPFDD_03408 [Phycisphaerae bacterium]|nr:hypothetical protein [Phycisphaerae bacterium]
MVISPDAAEWVDRAEGDVRALRKLDPVEDRVVVAFLAQQAAEKYLKATLVNSRICFPKPHDLVALVSLCRQISDEFESLVGAAAVLQPFAVDVRYPGPAPGEAAVRAAIENMDVIRTFCRERLALQAP